MTTHTSRRRVVRLLGPLAVLGLVTAACGSDDDSSSDDIEPVSTEAPTENTEPDTASEVMDGPTIQVRGQDFSEAITIAEVYGQHLEAKGYPVEILTPAGFRADALNGLENGDINLIIDYIGGTQAELAPEISATADADEIVANITGPIEAIGATLLDYSRQSTATPSWCVATPKRRRSPTWPTSTTCSARRRSVPNAHSV